MASRKIKEYKVVIPITTYIVREVYTATKKEAVEQVQNEARRLIGYGDYTYQLYKNMTIGKCKIKEC